MVSCQAEGDATRRSHSPFTGGSHATTSILGVGTQGSVLDDLLLLMLDEGRGTFRGGDRLAYGLAAALLSDLTSLGRIAVTASRVTVIEKRRTGHALLDEHLARLIVVSPERAPHEWIAVWARSGLVQRVADRLVTAGMLRTRIDRSLGVFSVRRYEIVPPRLRVTLRAYVRGVVLGDDQALPTEITSLAAILHVLDQRGVLALDAENEIGSRAFAPSDVLSGALATALARRELEPAQPMLIAAK